VRTFLLTWNPAQGRPADLSQIIAGTASGQPAPDTWSVGNRKDVPVGSRVFLHRQGADPRGIVAAGFTTTEPAADPTAGDASLYVGVNFTLALDDQKGHLVSVEELEQAPLLVNFPWNTQRGGVELHPGEAARVEALWADLLQRLGRREAQVERARA
jgi:5-methylcytosine-specific restriction protein A